MRSDSNQPVSIRFDWIDQPNAKFDRIQLRDWFSIVRVRVL